MSHTLRHQTAGADAAAQRVMPAPTHAMHARTQCRWPPQWPAQAMRRLPQRVKEDARCSWCFNGMCRSICIEVACRLGVLRGVLTSGGLCAAFQRLAQRPCWGPHEARRLQGGSTCAFLFHIDAMQRHAMAPAHAMRTAGGVPTTTRSTWHNVHPGATTALAQTPHQQLLSCGCPGL